MDIEVGMGLVLVDWVGLVVVELSYLSEYGYGVNWLAESGWKECR